ncbi:MAG TPA: M3 family metallopeptidase [Burkholderiales bacterium]|jgi:oligopeptidase A|nr:M3 family metallopeptidase [Burkholderiales bacterium]
MNPLLDFSGLPRFADFKPELVTPAIDQLLGENRALIERVAAPAVPATWHDFVEPLEDANERLGRAWGVVGHLNAVMNSPELREAYNSNLPKVTQYYTELSQHPGLYAKFKALAAGAEFAQLARARRKTVENELRDFRLGGAELPPEEKARYTAIREKLSEHSSRFSDNLLDATNAFSHYATDADDVAGIPEDVLQAAREAAQAEGKPGWKFTLHAPSYLPVMQYADSRRLRELMYRAYVTRASEFGKPEWDNSALITAIVKLRGELARLLGFANYAEYSLEPKMAESPRQVLEFLEELAARAKPYAGRDLDELKDFAARELSLARLESWDLAYASEKLRVARYAFSDQEVKQYFPETTVLPGMFRLVERLYGVSIAPAEAPVWHPDVRFYAVRDRAGALIGQFYVDLYARPSKRGGAWMDDAITRRRKDGRLQTPVAYLNCNFSAGVGGKPALFTHDEVTTLFHEFGHGLHHLLTRVDVLGTAGINGVEWDAVELPSQFMENFCWEWDVLAPMTSHVDTSAPLPRALFDKMDAAKNFQSGMQTVRQLEFALFDLHLHYDYDPEGNQSALDLLAAVRASVAVVLPPVYNRFPNNFSHIFAGGYAAGYYSYKWAEVLSADAYSLFEENGVLDPATGARFWDEILAVGGSRPALESFVAFRGREPKIDALMRHSGMADAL